MEENIHNELVIEQYKSTREEIGRRIEQHSKLWLYKMAGCAAITSFALTQKGFGKIAIMIVPFVVFVFDYLIVNNLTVISSLGRFIMEVIEANHFSQGWETTSSNPENGYFPWKTWLGEWMALFVFMLFVSLLVFIVFLQQGLQDTYWWSLAFWLAASVANGVLAKFAFKILNY